MPMPNKDGIHIEKLNGGTKWSLQALQIAKMITNHDGTRGHPLPHRPNLIHWGRVTNIYVSKQAIIGLDNDLSLDRRQASKCIWKWRSFCLGFNVLKWILIQRLDVFVVVIQSIPLQKQWSTNPDGCT